MQFLSAISGLYQMKLNLILNFVLESSQNSRLPSSHTGEPATLGSPVLIADRCTGSAWEADLDILRGEELFQGADGLRIVVEDGGG